MGHGQLSDKANSSLQPTIGILNSIFPTLLMGIVGFFLFEVFFSFFLKSRALSVLENLPVALNHISKQNILCRISFLSDLFLFIIFLFIPFILSPALRSEATGFSVFSESAHKTSLPCSHASTRTKSTSTKSPGKIEILPASTRPIQATLYTNSKRSPNNVAVTTVFFTLYKELGFYTVV